MSSRTRVLRNALKLKFRSMRTTLNEMVQPDTGRHQTERKAPSRTKWENCG
jgi:hypothetical protein